MMNAAATDVRPPAGGKVRVSGKKFVPIFATLLAIATFTFAWFAASTEQVRRNARARFLAAEGQQAQSPQAQSDQAQVDQAQRPR